MVQEQFKYSIRLQYLNVVKGTYRNIESENIKWVIIDRDYDINNMPLIYVSMALDKNLVDDMILNYKENLMNITIYKYLYDEDGYLPRIEEEYVKGQCEYYIDEEVNPVAPLDYSGDNSERDDILRTITIGMMKLDLINGNKKTFDLIPNNTAMVDIVKYCTKHLKTLVLEPFEFNEVIPQIIVPRTDSVSKVIKFLNNVKVFYSTPYRFFMDFDATYLISSSGLEIPKKGERINAVLIVVKSVTDYVGMPDGMFTNKKQKNYQINVPITSTSVSTDKLTEKSYTNITAITTSGGIENTSVDVAKPEYSDDKTQTVRLPNDNSNMLLNLKAETESNGMFAVVCKEKIDGSIFNINNRIEIKHIDEYSSYNGRYLLTRKRELFVTDGYDFVMSTIVNLKKLKS